MAAPSWWSSWNPNSALDMWAGLGLEENRGMANDVVGAYVLNQLIPWLAPQEQAMAAAAINAMGNARQYGFQGNYSPTNVGVPNMPSWDQTAGWLRGLGGMREGLNQVSPFLTQQFGAESPFVTGLQGMRGLAEQGMVMPRTAQGVASWENLMGTSAGAVPDWMQQYDLGQMFSAPRYRAPNFNVAAPIARSGQSGAQRWWG